MTLEVPVDLDGAGQLALLARRVGILSAQAYLWDGQEQRVDPSRPRTPVRTKEPIVAEVASRLYHEAYGRPHPGRGGYATLPDHDLRREWTDALRRQAPLVDDVQPGWLHVRAPSPPREAPLVRAYWHLSPQGAAPFLRAATRAMRQAKARFMLKLLDDPQSYRRADAAVLYVVEDDWPAVARALPRMHAAVAPWLRRSVPLLALRVAPGVGLAQDPGGDESFGMHRSRLVAEGLHAAMGLDAEARLDAVRRRLRGAGVDPEAPHLRLGSGALVLPALEAAP